MPGADGSQRGVLAGLGALLRRRRLRQLVAVRLLGQAGDGVFQAALAAVLVFSPERQGTPGAVAAAFALLLLPFAAIGPWVGVLLDRWRRRQVLVAANAFRAGVVALTAATLHGGAPDGVVVGLALLALSVDRALLAGLSAALPHVVEPEELVLANSVVPTAGTVAAGAGAALAVLLRAGPLGGADAVVADALLLVGAALLYVAGGAVALLLPASMLGPLHPVRRVPLAAPARQRLASGVRDVLGGATHALRRRAPAWALTVVAVHRFAFGVTTVAFVVLCRRTLADPADPAAGLALLTSLTSAAAVGAGAAAALAPWGTRRQLLRTWICGCLVVAGAAQAVVGWRTELPVLLACAFALGAAGQGAKIGADAVVQTTVDDAYRGRVFTLYDLVFNTTFVAAAAVAAVLVPDDGRFTALAVCLGVAYWGVALLYARTGGPSRPVAAAGGG
ncbi:MFS transporter [Kineococcus glutinatus]|uniref:MFS transporter n=1 Tax=Kineococcus glutinatus TaxID=1070872 RepID=A0ABP9HXU6_9ACTN